MENSLSQCSVMEGSLNSSGDGMFCSSVSSLYSCVFVGFAPLSLLFAFALVLWASLAVLGWLFAGTAACLCSFFSRASVLLSALSGGRCVCRWNARLPAPWRWPAPGEICTTLRCAGLFSRPTLGKKQKYIYIYPRIYPRISLHVYLP